jgi:hypothetical protein
MTRFPPRGPALPDCMDLSFDLGIGELAPGHQVIARGICLHDGGLVLHYEFAPGLTAEETYRNLSQFSFHVSYETDVPADRDDASTGVLAPSMGGATTRGSRSFRSPPREARLAWFDFFTADHYDPEGRVSRLTVDLITGDARVET